MALQEHSGFRNSASTVNAAFLSSSSRLHSLLGCEIEGQWSHMVDEDSEIPDFQESDL